MIGSNCFEYKIYVEFYARHKSKRGAMAVSRVHPYNTDGQIDALIECASSALSHPSMQHLSKGIIPLV
jgi:hypothetical protein